MLGQGSVKATVENPRGSVEKLFPKESVKGAQSVLLGQFAGTLTLPLSTVWAPKGQLVYLPG